VKMPLIATDSQAEAMSSSPLTTSGLRQASSRVLAIVAFALLPGALLGALLVDLSLAHPTNPNYYWDFHVFWRAGRAVMHARSPYPPVRASVLAQQRSFVYPAPAAFLMVPFALIPYTLSAAIFAFVLVASLPLALRIVGVRDWRCYGIALFTGPMLNAVAVGAISPLLAIPLALVWRYRDRLWVAAAGAAAAITLKLFLWPLLLWFVFTRRTLTAAASVVLIAVPTLAAWAVIDFHSLLAYPRMLNLLSNLLDGKGYSLIALGRSTGLWAPVARALPWVVGAAVLAAIALLGRRSNGERPTFVLAVGAALALSPIIWLHYFVLLFIPIAVVAPRLSPLWALPLAFWILGGQSVQPPIWDAPPKVIDLAKTPPVGHAWLVVYALAVTTVILGLCVRATAGAPLRPLSARRSES